MTIYLTNTETHEYIGQDIADPSPLEPGVYLIPAGAYMDAPPEAQDGEVIVRMGDEWVVFEDHREDTLYINILPMHPYELGAECDGMVYNGLGPIPEWLTTVYQRTEEEAGESIRETRDRLINDIRWRVERHQDEVALSLDPTEPIEPILEYIQALRDVPQQENFPHDVVWPAL